MCLSERNTTRRGRAWVPDRVLRTRTWRRSRFADAVVAFAILLASRLAGLPANDFARVLDALALVRLGRTQVAQLGRDLPHFLLVGAVDHDRRRLRRGELHARRRLVLDRVREAERELEPERLHFRLVADAGNLERLLISLRDAFDHVRQQRARQAVERLVVLFVGGARDMQHLAFLPDGDALRELARELALRTLHLHRVAVDRDRDALRDRNRQLADT